MPDGKLAGASERLGMLCDRIRQDPAGKPRWQTTQHGLSKCRDAMTHQIVAVSRPAIVLTAQARSSPKRSRSA
jgi:hypothetical protein